MDRPGGGIEVICGSMFSGKTKELIRRVRRAQIAHQQVQVIKHALDDRYAPQAITSHNGARTDAVPVSGGVENLIRVEPAAAVVAIDEVQFLDGGICRAAAVLAQRGVRVILAGLDTDFRGEPFGPLPQLLAMAEEVGKLQAIRMVCGAQETYQARCRRCHEVPGRPML